MNPHLTDNTPVIHQLPNFLIDQIKAGEVVERPSQAIKEIIENAIDAGADRISLEIRDNGLELIFCQDNGIGMSYSQLPMAFRRHATSKIDRYEDLFNLDTFGFRGEALASVAAVSRLSCYSRPKSREQQGGKIVFAGGQQVEYFENDALEAGTSLSIENLFYNTPARLKFIRSKQSEKNAINKILYSFLLSNHEITFTIKWDDQEKKIYPACEKQVQRIGQLFNKKKGQQVLDFSIEHDGYSIKGFYSLQANKGNLGKNQYFFINNRYFQDKALHMVVLRSLEYLWGAGGSGHYCMFINSPKDQVDVNVHPSKTFIKFQNPSLVHSLVNAGIKQNLIKKKSEDHIPAATTDFNQNSQGVLTYDNTQIKNTFNPNKNDQGRNPSNIFPLDSDHLILKLENNILLINYKALIAGFFKLMMESETLYPPQALLVAEPFNEEIDIGYLHNKGFHIEAIQTKNDSKSIHLVRAVPSWILDIGVRPYLKLLVYYLNGNLRLDTILEQNLNERSIRTVIEKIPEEVRNHNIKEITSELILKWMNFE